MQDRNCSLRPMLATAKALFTLTMHLEGDSEKRDKYTSGLRNNLLVQ